MAFSFTKLATVAVNSLTIALASGCIIGVVYLKLWAADKNQDLIADDFYPGSQPRYGLQITVGPILE